MLLLPPAANACPRISAGGSSERSSFAATFLQGTLWWLPPRVCAQRRSGCFGALPPGTRLVYRAPSRGAGRGRPRETIPRPPRAPPPMPLFPGLGGRWGGFLSLPSRGTLSDGSRRAPLDPAESGGGVSSLRGLLCLLDHVQCGARIGTRNAPRSLSVLLLLLLVFWFSLLVP